MARKEWHTLHLINTPIYFLGFKPIQWVFISCCLFMIGWFAWWLAVLLFYPVYVLGKKVSRAHSAGHPNLLLSLVIWYSMKKYFIDPSAFFNRL